MTNVEKSSLLIWCGALHDIAEQCKDEVISIQIATLEIRIETLVLGVQMPSDPRDNPLIGDDSWIHDVDMGCR
jgi:hypothetical protein